MDILDLPGWRLLEAPLDGEGYRLVAEFLAEPDTCQGCGVIGRMYRHGTHATTYRDSPIRGHQVRIVVNVRRYKCRDCGLTCRQTLTGIREDRRMTERCAQYIQKQCLLDTFVRIAADVGCDEKTVRALASQHIEHVDGGYLPKLPEWLGLDETKIDGKQRLVITDIGGRRPIEMLADRDRRTLAGWLHRFKDRSMVKGVAIDMWRPYLNVCHQLLPGVPVVVDKFHIVRMASRSMESVRIRLQKRQKAAVRRDWLRSKATLNMRAASLSEKQRFNRDMWLDNEPDLAAAYRLKEAFYDLFDLPKDEAVQAFDGFAASVPAHLKPDFKKLLTAMTNWRTEILAVLDTPITNAYTEALNGVAKTINRTGKGYSFEVLRARLLFRSPGARIPVSHPRGPLVPHNGPGSADPKRALRCMSCFGLFDKRVFKGPAHIRPIAPSDEPLDMLMVCSTCNARFHTD